MSAYRRFLFRCGLVVVPVVVVGALALLWSSHPSPLPIVSSNARFGVTLRCTFGTNHMHFYGGPLDGLLDPAITRLSPNPNPPNRLSFDTADPSTALWVRVTHPDYGNVAARSVVVATPTGPARYPIGDIPRFRALLRSPSTGAETTLERKTGIQQFNKRCVISGFSLPGSLETHRGSVLRIESTNGEEVVTFRIP